VHSADELFNTACSLLRESEAEKRGVRLLGITLSNLDLETAPYGRQLELPLGGGNRRGAEETERF